MERVLIFGGAIVAAAFLLTWASETAEKDISQGLALAAIALIAVLPEYAVDLYLAWTAPDTPDNAHFATANMTGANRLLVGVGWPMVFFIFWLRTKKKVLRVGGHDTSLGLIFLAAATLYSFVIPIKGNLSLIDTGVLVSLFAGYVYLVSRAPAEEPELVGPAQTIGALPDLPRRIVVVAMFLYSATAIFASAEPFVNGLVGIGEAVGHRRIPADAVVGPPGLGGAGVHRGRHPGLRGRALAAMVMLISSKVNQWTLLIGTLPVAYSISGATSVAPAHGLAPGGGGVPDGGAVGLRHRRLRQHEHLLPRGGAAAGAVRHAALLHRPRGALRLRRGLPAAGRLHPVPGPAHHTRRLP